MSTSVQQVDETAILSSLYGTTLPGLHAMSEKRSCAPIKHLILSAIKLKEAEGNEAAAHRPKPKANRRTVAR